ncbi:methylsterol monooxygenase 1-like [Atheta coriaria]|uniref:methylsterol monooxygenase 1-like n=1 Tax=Dalotia coriaria TaxID=877792 RepID=UPI0031F45DD4
MAKAKKVPNDPMAVRWAEKYSDSLDTGWSKLPSFVSKIVATIAICLLGLSINGEWLNISVHIAKQFGYFNQKAILEHWSDIWEKRFANLWGFWLGAVIVSYTIYFVIGGFLHWYFYVRQRDRPEEWKCQPKKWLSPELELHEILFGSFTLLVNSSASALVSCYISNGGYSTVYYNFGDYPWWWNLLQVPIVFIYQDYITYLIHRLYHTPFLYKHFHKLHHKYKQPTAFSVTAIHPVESLHIQSTYLVPLFVLPVHWLPYYAIQIYVYYHGIIDHSGVNFKAYWWQPWQPDAIFHDNHHQYFHVNFGFNCFIWDKLHGTYRRKDRIYTEDIYYGRGKAISEVTHEELDADIKERLSENPLAYRSNELDFKLTNNDLKSTNGSAKKAKSTKAVKAQKNNVNTPNSAAKKSKSTKKN